MKQLLILSVVLCAGCGAILDKLGNNNSTQPRPTLVVGSWSGSAVSNSGRETTLVFANVQAQGGGQYFATSTATLLCLSGSTTFPGCIQFLPQESSIGPTFSMTEAAGNQVVAGTITITDKAIPPQTTGTLSFSGTPSSDGKSITGSYSLTGSDGIITGPDSGTFTARAISQASVSGTYNGSITGSASGSKYPISFTITDNSDFSVTGSASIGNSPCVSSMTFVTSSHTELSYSIGDAFQLASYGTTANPYVLTIDVVPNGDGTYRMFLNFSAQTCSFSGVGTASKQ